MNMKHQLTLYLSVSVYILLLGLVSHAAVNPSPDSVLQESVFKGDVNKVREALDAGANPNSPSFDGTMLHTAARKGDAQIVSLLVSRRADVSAKNRDGETPLHSATTGAAAEALIKGGADINARTPRGRLPIHSACWSPFGTADVVRYYLSRGIDPDVLAGNDTPLSGDNHAKG
jgi:cytohesin